MSTDLQRLIDNGWIVCFSKGVDRQCHVAVRTRRQGWKDVMANITSDDGETLHEVHGGVPRQRASGATAEAALRRVCEQLFERATV